MTMRWFYAIALILCVLWLCFMLFVNIIMNQYGWIFFDVIMLLLVIGTGVGLLGVWEEL